MALVVGGTLDPDDERQVVIAPRPPSSPRPQHGPLRRPDGESVSLGDDRDPSPVERRSLEKLRDGGVRLRDLDDRVMDIHRPDIRMADEVCDRTEVIDVGMRHHDRIDATAARGHPWQQRAPSDAAVAA